VSRCTQSISGYRPPQAARRCRRVATGVLDDVSTLSLPRAGVHRALQAPPPSARARARRSPRSPPPRLPAAASSSSSPPPPLRPWPRRRRRPRTPPAEGFCAREKRSLSRTCGRRQPVRRQRVSICRRRADGGPSGGGPQRRRRARLPPPPLCARAPWGRCSSSCSASRPPKYALGARGAWLC